MQKKIDISGKRFGRLIAIKEVSKTHWECVCDCGNVKNIRKQCLMYDITKSCGCLAKESARKKQTKHGFKYTRIYYVWRGIKARCLNTNSPAYKSYGAKGIVICEEWKEFVNFKDWAFKNGYQDNFTIDRIDNSKGYYPENCRWTDKTTQTRNRSVAIKIKMKDGTFLYTKEFCEERSMTNSTLHQRITKLKKENKELTEESVLLGFEKGFKKTKYKIIHNNTEMSINEYCKITNLSTNSMRGYLKRKGVTVIESSDIEFKKPITTYYEGKKIKVKELAVKLNIPYNTLFSRARKKGYKEHYSLEELGVD